MADIISKDIAGRVLLMPLRAMTISNGTDTITFLQLEAESSYRIEPVVRTNDLGMPVTIAYDLTANIYIPNNNYGTGLWFPLLTGSFTGKPVSVILPLGAIASWPFKPASLTDHNTAVHIKPINTTGIPAHQHYINSGPSAFITVEIESVELRPRMIIRVKATVKSFSLNRALYDETTNTGNLKIITNTFS